MMSAGEAGIRGAVSEMDKLISMAAIDRGSLSMSYKVHYKSSRPEDRFELDYTSLGGPCNLSVDGSPVADTTYRTPLFFRPGSFFPRLMEGKNIGDDTNILSPSSVDKDGVGRLRAMDSHLFGFGIAVMFDFRNIWKGDVEIIFPIIQAPALKFYDHPF